MIGDSIRRWRLRLVICLQLLSSSVARQGEEGRGMRNSVGGWGVFYISLCDYVRLFHLSLPHFQVAKQE